MTDAKYDALLLLSFGGPEKPDDVMPFLRNVTKGRGVPDARLLEVAEHYQHFGGKSPINDQNRSLIAALEAELEEHGPRLPVYFGNRNWEPYLVDTLREMRDAGVERVLCFATSAYGSYSGCRQYREDIARARAELGEDAPEVHLLRKFFDHPGFIAANVARVKAAYGELPEQKRKGARLIFTAHSIPLSMAETSPYLAQLEETARLVAEGAGLEPGEDTYDLVWQSRSGPPQVPWLEPDVCDHVEALAAAGIDAVVVAPIGFISDHMEVIYDLDDELLGVVQRLGITMARAGTAGVHPAFVKMIRELIDERVAGGPRAQLGRLPLAPDECAESCCPRPVRPTGRGGRPSGAKPSGRPGT